MFSRRVVARLPLCVRRAAVYDNKNMTRKAEIKNMPTKTMKISDVRGNIEYRRIFEERLHNILLILQLTPIERDYLAR